MILNKNFHTLIGTLLTIQLIGCGTILYPERKGQRSGHIDIGVALLDGIGLFFFFIPGIIAYAIDFSNGTIYLPGTSMSSADIENLKQINFDPKNSTIASIEVLIKEQTGHTVHLQDSNTKITKLKSIQEMAIQFAQTFPALHNHQVALIR